MCRKILGVLFLLYLGALGLFLIGTFGLFGSDTGPLAGIFLIPLAMPWTFLIDMFPEPMWPWLGAFAPLINLAILRIICNRFQP